MNTKSRFALRLACVVASSVLLLASLTSCSRANSADSSPAPLATRLRSALACQAFEDEFFDGLYAYLLAKKPLPPVSLIEKSIDGMLSDTRFRDLSAQGLGAMKTALTELYATVAIETPKEIADDPKDLSSQLEAIAAMEMGDRLTEAKSRMLDRIRARFARVEQILASENMDLECAPSAEALAVADEGPLLNGWRSRRSLPVYGGLKALATAYQSCDAGSRDALSTVTPDAGGIKIIGKHPDGVGNKRVVGDLQALLDSSPYLIHYQAPSSSCFAVQKSPPIYDYGGKPFASTSGAGKLDLFKDAGSGTKVLGIDCSGYVYTAYATAGLKMKKSGRLKASGVFGVKSSMWREPRRNGLDCFDFASFEGTQSLRPGDVLGSNGHVIMIEDVGTDPFGIGGLAESECKRENMSVSRFSFTILQSAPVKGGLGIVRMRGADYLAAGGAMLEAMLDRAVEACIAKTRDTKIVTVATTAGLVRHLGTAQCKGSPIALAKQDCLKRCPASE